MTIATKTLATMMLVAMLTISATGVGQLSTATDASASQSSRESRQLQRLYRRADRKMELRASVLGIGAHELRDSLRRQPFEQIIKQAGFKTPQSFQTAMVGKIKDELRQRGWTDYKIQQFVEKRIQRYDKPLA